MPTTAPPAGRSLAWARASGGRLDRRQRRALRRPLARGLVSHATGWPRLWIGRPAGRCPAVAPPDSKLAREAEEAARTQPPALEGHGHRTWIFGTALAHLDGTGLDLEAFYVVALLHDAGLTDAVMGEDFTVRSAQVVGEVVDAEPGSADRQACVDAVVAHATPGVTPGEDPLAHYVQAGALADLTGLRAWELSRSQVRDAYARHPALDVHRVVSGAIRREARTVPTGRFAALARVGLPLVVRWSPMRAS